LISIRIRLAIALIIILTLCGLADYFHNSIPFIQNLPNDYFRGFFTETVGIVLTVFLVDLIFSQHEIKVKKQKSLEALARANLLCRTHFDNFKRYAYFLTTPSDKRETGDGAKSFNKEFKFQDMHTLFEPSFTLMDDFQEPIVFKCLKILNNLKDSLEKILLNIDLSDYPKISNMFLRTVDIITKSDIYDAIKFDYNATGGNPKEPIYIRDEMKKAIKEYTGEVKMHYSNMINKYVLLYFLVRTVGFVEEEYTKEVKSLLKT